MSKREMLINYVPGEECRIAITEDGRLEELYQERASAESHVGNIYKGRVLNVEPSIQAAFIDFGLERNGFLHISDLHPKYFPGDAREETEQVGLKTPRRDRPPIQKCLRRGQTILVQVLKEGIGTKGPTLTSYLSIPSRYLVMMSDMEKVGVSRKVDDDEARAELREVIKSLNPPQGFGLIGRTAAIDVPKTEIKRDFAYLQRLWKNIERRMNEVNIGELFAESDLLIRTIRDVYSSDIERIIVDDAAAAQRARDYLAIASPRGGANVLVYRDAVPLFHRYGIEGQIENINARVVPLESGGSLVIDSTEALVAIDVNSGKNRDSRDAEMTAYRTNLEAVDEICRQLRLRDLGGVIVNDLIDMRSPKFRREVEARFKDNLKRDRARTRTSPISQFGILEMTRQRMRPSLTKSIYTDCPACAGMGSVKSPESVVLDVMRRLQLVMHRDEVARVELTVSPDVAFQLLNRKRGGLVAIEQQHNKPVLVRVNGGGGIDFLQIGAFDARGTTINLDTPQRFAEPTLETVAAAIESEPVIEEEEPQTGSESAETRDDSEATSPHEPAGPNQPSSREARDSGAEGQEPSHDQDGEPQEGGRRRRRRRGGRRRRGRGGQGEGQPQDHRGQPHEASQPSQNQSDEPQTTDERSPADGSSYNNPIIQNDETADTNREPEIVTETDPGTPEPGNEKPPEPEIEEIDGNRVEPEDESGDESEGEPATLGPDGQPTGDGKRRRRRRGGRRHRKRRERERALKEGTAGGDAATGEDKPQAIPQAAPAPAAPPPPPPAPKPKAEQPKPAPTAGLGGRKPTRMVWRGEEAAATKVIRQVPVRQPAPNPVKRQGGYRKLRPNDEGNPTGGEGETGGNP